MMYQGKNKKHTLNFSGDKLKIHKKNIIEKIVAFTVIFVIAMIVCGLALFIAHHTGILPAPPPSENNFPSVIVPVPTTIESELPERNVV